MTTRERVQRSVGAYLEANGFRATEQDGAYALRFASARVWVEFFTLGAQTIIGLRAPVLSALDAAVDDVRLAQVLAAMNHLNCRTLFGKWAYYAGSDSIVLEYDFLGDHLQEEELMTAIAQIARLADAEDDRLQSALGFGQRAFER